MKDEQPVLGVAVRNSRNTELYHQRFLAYMTAHYGLQIGAPLKTDRWVMPKISAGCPIDYGVGRVLFAGDSAGFLNPMGEGISAAIESGYCAARAVIDNFRDRQQVLAQYRRDTRALHDYMKRQWNFIGRMSDTFAEMMQ